MILPCLPGHSFCKLRAKSLFSGFCRPDLAYSTSPFIHKYITTAYCVSQEIFGSNWAMRVVYFAKIKALLFWLYLSRRILGDSTKFFCLVRKMGLSRGRPIAFEKSNNKYFPARPQFHLVSTKKGIEPGSQNHPTKILRTGLVVFLGKMARQKSGWRNPLKKTIQKRKFMLLCKWSWPRVSAQAYESPFFRDE